MKSQIVLILLVLVNGGYSFDFADVKSMDIYVGEKRVAQCVGRASRINSDLEKLEELADELSWSDEAIEHELRKYPDLQRLDADDLEKAKAYCKVTILRGVHR